MTFPVEIECCGTSLHPHALFEVLAYGAGFQFYLFTRKRYKRSLVPADQTVWILAGAIVGALLGSKALSFLEHPNEWNLEMLLTGKTIVGGLLGGWIGVEIAKRTMGVRHSTGDACVFPLLLGMSVGRVGCFLTGLEDKTHGIATDLPWSVDFGDDIARHPTQLYDIVFLVALGTVFFVRRRQSAPNGATFRTFIASYAAYRFLIEFIKPRETWLFLSAIQIACAAGFVIAIYSLRRLEPAPSGSSHGQSP